MRHLLLLLSFVCCIAYAENRSYEVSNVEEKAAECSADPECEALYLRMEARKAEQKKTKPLISGWDLAFLAFVLIGFYYWRNRNESEQEGNIEKHVVTKQEELKLDTLQEFKLHAVTDEQELDEHEKFLKDLELRSRKNR
ncbi:hypothetical protein [Undibacterium curvum]|uniref:Transmembrane protein n=1 Tax=Undibacterium curvum TaxID=2762294 RepID=A0ABR7A0Y3_9BURK|nr:hypothetical protein [Undibacterium curvum]MBC3930575.1 hypothetical protein [Undibacterium curvum]